MKHKQGISLMVLAGLMVLLYVANTFYFSRRPIMYPNFGITIPAGYNAHGIDVSRYQKNIDWDLVKNMTDKGQRISFAIVKATERSNTTDPKFSRNWEKLKDANLLRGAYLYFHPNRDGKSQAEYFMETVELMPGDLPPVVDVEETKRMSKAKVQKALKECLDALEKRYETKPMIYTSVDFYEQYLGDEFSDYPLWAAHYEQVHKPRIDRDWILWQHNCQGHVNGIHAR